MTSESVTKPEHSFLCQIRPATIESSIGCPACAWELAIDMTLRLVEEEASEPWYQVTLGIRLRALREKLL